MHYKQLFLILSIIIAAPFCSAETTAPSTTEEVSTNATSEATDAEALTGHVPNDVTIVIDTRDNEVAQDDDELDPETLKLLDNDNADSLTALKVEPTIGSKLRTAAAIIKEKAKITAKQAKKHFKKNKGKWLVSILGIGGIVTAVKLCSQPSPKQHQPVSKPEKTSQA